MFQATPPAKRTKDDDTESPLGTRQINMSNLSRTAEEDPAAEDVTSGYDDSPIRVRSVERDAALEALTRSAPEEEEQEPSEIIAPVQSAAVHEVEVNSPDEFSFTKPKKSKKKDKKKQADQFGLEDDLSSTTVTPPSMADSSRDIEGPPEFSLKKSKKDKKKDKKRGSNQWDADDEPSEKAAVATAIEAATLESDVVDEPSQSVSIDALQSSVDPAPEELEIIEGYSLKKSKKDKKKDRKKAIDLSEPGSDASPSTALSPSIASAVKEADTVDEPSKPFSGTVLPSSVEPAENVDTIEEFSLKKSKKDKKKDKKKALDSVDPENDATPSAVLLPSNSSALEEADVINDYSEPLPRDVLLPSVEPAEDIDTVEEFSLKKDKKRDKKKALDSVDPDDDSSLSTLTLPAVASTVKEADTVDEPSEPLSEPLLPSSIEPADDIDTPEEFSVKKSKKNKKKALDWTEDGDEVSQITVLPSSVASAAQEPDPSDEYSSTTSKKDKMNRRSLSRSSTLVEPGPVEPSKSFEAKDEDFSRAEQTPLPVSRALSEIGTGSELGDVNTQTRDILPSQEESLQPAEPFVEPASAKESVKSKKKGRKSLPSWELDEPCASEVVANEPVTEPIDREADNFGSESKDITDIQTEPQVEARVDIIPPNESEVVRDEPVKVQQVQKDIVEGEPGRESHVQDKPVKEEPGNREISVEDPTTNNVTATEEEPVKDELLKDEPLRDEPVKVEQIQKDFVEAYPDRELPLLDKPVEKEVVEGNASGELPVPDEPVREELGNRDLGVEGPRTKDNTVSEDDDQSKPVEPLFEASTAKGSKKSKKKKGKSFQAWQDDEAQESQSTVDPVSEPTTAVSSERDLSGFSTPTWKSEGKKKQKRKSIAWDVKELEPEPTLEATQSIAASDLNTRDAPEETDQHKEVVELPRLELAELITISQDNDIKEESDHIREPNPREEITADEPEVATKEIKESLAQTGPSVLSAMPTESEPFGTARSDFSGVEYFPSAASLHSPQVPKDLGESVETGYVPSAVRLLPVAAPILAVAAAPKVPETTDFFIERDVLEPKSQVPDEQSDESKPSTPYSEEQHEAARQLNAEFGSGKKKSKKNKKGRADLSLTSTQDDDFPAEVANEPQEAPEQTGFNREIQAADEAQPTDGLVAGFKEEQVLLAKQLQAEFESGAKKTKKGKKSRSTSRTPRDYESGSTFFEEPQVVEESQAADTEPAEEVSREIIPEDEEAPRKHGPDGLAAGFTPEQLEAARQLREDFATGSKKPKKGKSRSTSRTPREYDSGPSFEETHTANIQPVEETSREIIPEDEDAPRTQAPDGLAAGFIAEQLEAARQMREDSASGSKKSKKDKKRKSLIRSATDENISGPAAEGGSEETSLATTEVDSATDSPYPLSTVPTPDDFESSFTTKKGKKGKKRQSLLRSFTQDSEDSAGPSREITAEPELIQLGTSEMALVKATDITPEPIPDPEDKLSSAVDGEPEAFSFSTKKGKKGKKKRQSLLRTATQEEEPSSDPTSGVIEPEATQKEVAEASTSQPPSIVGDDDMAALGEELNFNLKKSKKKGKRGKDIDEARAGTGNVSQPAEQGIETERDLAPKNGRDQESLADRIWASVIPTESIQPETENPSAESEDPLGLYTTKISKKNKKKGQAKSTSASELEPFLTDRDVGDPGVPMDVESKEPPSWIDKVAEVEVEKKQPKLFDTWSFGNLPLDETAQETPAYEPQTTSKDVEVVHDIRQEEPVERSHTSLPTEDDRLQESTVQENERSTMNLEPVNVAGTPPPAMPKALAWEDEPAQQQQRQPPEVKEVDVTDLPAPRTEGRDAPDAKGKAKQGLAKPVSAGILAAGAALLAGASMGHGKEPTEAEPLSTGIPRSAAENNEPNTLRRVESEKKREKRPAKLLDRRSLPKDDLFDDPMLWEGPEAQKFGDHVIEDEAGDDTGFWSAPVEEENTKDDFAVDDVEDGPSSMPHKRERSESLMDVWEPSTVLDNIKTPRKHQYEDVPAAMARDATMEQEIAEEQPRRAEDLNRDIREEDPVQSDKPEPVSQWNDVPEDILTQSSKKAKKNKKQSRLVAWDAPLKDEEADVGSSYTTIVDPSISRDIDAAPIEDHRTSIISEATKDHGRDRYRDQESRSPPSSALPFVSEPESHVRRTLDEETFQPSRREHEESAKDKHRHQEIYLPPSSTTSRAIVDESVLRRELHVASPQLPSEGRAKDKHRRQESYLPPPSTLPAVIEEEYHKPESGHVSHERGINDNNRDSAFVTESPVPFQRRIADDHEHARDSGVHLGDTPVSKEKPHIASADDALARLSWPTVDEETETVDLKRSQRPKDERSPKSHAPIPALIGAGAGAVAVTELAHLAARSPPQNKYEHGDNAKVDRSITPNMGRLQTPDHSKYRPGSVGSNRSSGTPPLRRSDPKLSGDLRSLSQRSQANLAKEAKDAREADRSPATSIVNINPIANEGRPRVKDMADVYVSHQQASGKIHSMLTGPQDGYGEGRIGSPMSPTRPHSMRRRQSMQVLDLEARVEQLAAENRMLAEAKELAEHSLQSSQRATLALADRDAEVDSLKQRLDWLHREVERLKEVNDGLTSANITLGRKYGALESQHADAARELEDLRQTHRGLSGGIEDVVMERVAAATQEKDREIAQLRQDLEAAHERIREMQREILTAKGNDSEFLVFRDEDYFDNACQQLCQHVQQWVLRFSKFSDMRACRGTYEINNDKIIDRLDNAVLDGSDVDEYLSDRVKRRDIFMSMTMTMIWEFVFTRYLFGMDREQRQKLKSLEKTLLEVGPPAAVHQWRATTLTLLSKREAFQQQRKQDTVAVVQMIFQTLSEILPPPTHLEEQIQEQLMRVMKAAVDLSIEMRTQRAEYMMLPPLQPEYDANGDLARQVQFNAALMNERSGDTVSNEELEAQHAVVRIVLFPLVVKKGDDTGGGDDEIVVCPAQVLVAKPKRHARGLTPEGMGQNPNHSRVSLQSSMPIDQRVPDI